MPDEVTAVSALLDEELHALEGHGIAAKRPPLGIMVEVPATAIAIDRFPADFYSIGSNDLTQYVMAAARDNRALAALLDPTQEALLRLVENVVRYGRQNGRSVSLCGEAAGDPQAMPRLLERGLRSLSVTPAALGRVARHRRTRAGQRRSARWTLKRRRATTLGCSAEFHYFHT